MIQDVAIPGSVAAYLRPRKDLVDAALAARLPGPDAEPREVHAAMRHAALGCGKRLRPVLVIAVGEFAGRTAEQVLDAACALELVHTASLILDDLPCMDNAVTRRGAPCTHVQFGEATALLAVVGLIGLAFELVAAGDGSGRAVQALARAIGAAGLVHGQYGDLRCTGEAAPLDVIEGVHQHKAGSLFLASVQVPGYLSGLPESAIDALGTYAQRVGLAFQIADDLRDAGPRSEDAGKSTFVTHLGLDGARRAAEDLVVEALRALDGFGDRAEPFRLIGGYVRSLAQ